MLQKEPLTEQAKSFKGLNIAGIENTVLATIVNRKVQDVKELKVTGKRTAPLVSFKKALSDRTKKNFILECKKLYCDMLKEECFLDKSIIDKWYPAKDYHKAYVLEITHAYIKE